MLKRDLRWFKKVLVVILGYVRNGVEILLYLRSPMGLLVLPDIFVAQIVVQRQYVKPCVSIW